MTEGDGAPALAATRSLGRRGVLVSVLAEEPDVIGFRSRYCAERLHSPPLAQGTAWLEFLAQRLRERRYVAVVPCGDESAFLLSEGRDALLPHTALLLPARESFRSARDKLAVVQLAERCGVPAPRTLLPRDVAEASALAPALGFPLVVKGRGGEGSLQVRLVRSAGELEARFEEVARLAGSPPMLQELVAGEGVGYGGVFVEGRPALEFQWRRLREYPREGGPSAAAESIADPATAASGRRLLAELCWSGIAMVEFKRGLDGTARVMEINPRLWGSVELALRCGVDVPGAYLAGCRGELAASDSPPAYAVGRRLSLLFPRGLARALTSPRGAAELLGDALRPGTWLDLHLDDLAPALRQAREARWLVARLRARAAGGQRSRA